MSAATRLGAAAGACRLSAALLRASSIPVFDLELWLVLGDPIRDLEFKVLGTHSLVESDGGPAFVITVDRTLAGEERDQFMLADFEITEIDFLDAAFQQRVGLAGGIEIILDFLVVDLEGHRIQGEECADVH